MKTHRFVTVVAISLTAFVCSPSTAGMIVEVRDPRQLQQQQEIIFPQAEVKIVAFEFESVGADERGKQQAKALHDQFLAKIQDVQGGAIVTYVAKPGEKIQGYRVTVEQVARQQNAQIAVWGRVFVDAKGTVLTNMRVSLIERPPGISAEYLNTAQPASGAPVSTRGVIDAPVYQTRIDFITVAGDISPLATFLSGLVRYYKGSARDGAVATRWLGGSIVDFQNYLAAVNERADVSAAAQAHLYLARAQVRLAAIDKANGAKLLGEAKEHADKAALLNAYNSEAPTVQAVIAAKMNAPVAVMQAYLSKAIAAAPVDSTARVNAAVLDSAQGKYSDATKQLDNVGVMYEVGGYAIPSSVTQLKESIAKRR
jgi:roadblock/LC7 domain-containing protein